MAKKHFGKFFTIAAIAGAAAAGISYFLRYKSFHEELNEDFHDFEDDFDTTENAKDTSGVAARSYVSLTPDRPAEGIRETVEETITEAADEGIDETIKNTVDETQKAEESEAGKAEALKAQEELSGEADESTATTTIVEDTTE